MDYTKSTFIVSYKYLFKNKNKNKNCPSQGSPHCLYIGLYLTIYSKYKQTTALVQMVHKIYGFIIEFSECQCLQLLHLLWVLKIYTPKNIQ